MQISNNIIGLAGAAVAALVVSYSFGNMDGASSGHQRGAASATLQFQKGAVKQGVAQYDAENGHWRWKTPEEMAVQVITHTAPKLAALPEQPTVITPTMADILPHPDLLAPAPEPLPEKKKSKK